MEPVRQTMPATLHRSASSSRLYLGTEHFARKPDPSASLSDDGAGALAGTSPFCPNHCSPRTKMRCLTPVVAMIPRHRDTAPSHHRAIAPPDP